MKKVKIIGMGKQKNRVKVILKKEQIFVELFRDFLRGLDFEDWEFPDFCLDYDIDNEEVDAKVNKLIDEAYSFRNKKFDVDIIFGKSKIFVTVYSKGKDLQKEISEKLFKFCEFEEVL